MVVKWSMPKKSYECYHNTSGWVGTVTITTRGIRINFQSRLLLSPGGANPELDGTGRPDRTRSRSSSDRQMCRTSFVTIRYLLLIRSGVQRIKSSFPSLPSFLFIETEKKADRKLDDHLHTQKRNKATPTNIPAREIKAKFRYISEWFVGQNPDCACAVQSLASDLRLTWDRWKT